MSISRVKNNISALNANFNLDRSGRRLSKSIERLSSGLRINRSGDDAAGLTIATRLRSQVRGLDRAIMNAEDGINVINVAESAMEEMTRRLDRIRVLSIQAANTGVNDVQARQALQDEVFQSIDEISRIANTTQFGKNFLLNGDYGVQVDIKPGQDGVQNFGISIDNSPGANTLESGTHYLNIIRTANGHQHFLPGKDSNGITATMNLGIQNATDIAVTLARFSSTTGLSGTAATSATLLGVSGATGGFFNGVSINNGDMVHFEGVLADGVTKFSGTLSASGVSDIGLSTETTSNQSLLGLINKAIDDAESALFGVTTASVPSSFRTTVTLAVNTTNNRGRLLMVSSQETINQSSINFTLVRSNNVVSQSEGVVRSGAIGGASVLSGSGQIGNGISAITGSTFGTGQFVIEVTEVQGPQNRTVDGSIVFRDHAGTVIDRTTSLTHSTRGLKLNGNFVDGVYTGGVSITAGDTINIRGTEADGTTFEAAYTLSHWTDTDTDLDDFTFATISGLIEELNYRTRDYQVNTMDGKLSRWETGITTFTPDGKLRLIDDIARNDSKLDFTLTFNDGINNNTPSYTLQDGAVLVKEGFAESATIRVNGGPEVRASAGDVVTAYGKTPTKEGDVLEEVTFRVGSNLAVGTDILEVEAQQFIGSLNNGPRITFQNGAQDVAFVDNGSLAKGVARVLTVDFDAIMDVTASSTDTPDPGVTILISSVNNSMNFHIGAFADQNFQTAIGDLTADNLGFGRNSGRTIENIDIRTVEGANESLRIVDKALDQVNRTRALLGAATNRLEGSIASLSVSEENLLAAESRLRDVDMARETSQYAKEQMLVQAGVSVLAQANFLPQQFLSLLG
jgi:flagellin